VLELSGQAGISQRGDAERYNMDLTVGGNFDNGRGNMVSTAAITIAPRYAALPVRMPAASWSMPCRTAWACSSPAATA
jgi:hypothetical protein